MATKAELLITKNAELVLYREALAAILKNQSYTIKDRTYTRATLSEVRKGIKDLENEIAKIERGGIRTGFGFPRSY